MSEVKIPQALLDVIANVNIEEINSHIYTNESMLNWLCAWHEEVKRELYDFANNHELYEKGRADALDIDMEKPMHFTDEQKAWIKNYIIINAKRQRADAIEEFKKYLLKHKRLVRDLKTRYLYEAIKIEFVSDTTLDEYFALGAPPIHG